MADESLNDETELELPADEVELEAPEGEAETSEDDDDEELILTLGDGTESEPDDTPLIKHMREQLKQARKEAAEARRSAPAPEPVVVGDKPTLANCEYDEEAYEQQLDAWKERKALAERQQAEKGKATATEQEQWAAELRRYEEGKQALGFKGMADAEDNVKAAMSPIQQAVLVKAADDPAKVIAALGTHPDRLAQLAGIEDPLKLAAAIARLEGQLKMVKRRKAPEPETIERGSAPTSKPLTDKTLAKLEKEADRTGNRTAVIAYKRKLRAAQA